MLEASDTSSVICSCMVYAGRVLQTKGMQDQVLTLVLLGQIEMAKAAKGMLVAFIDFTKAYDKVDRVKLWGCLELKLSTTKLIGECEVELSCALVKSKAERRMMLKLRGGPSQAASPGSHGGIKEGLSSKEHWRESSPCIVTGL